MVASLRPRRRLSELAPSRGAIPPKMQQPLGERLGVDARDGQREQIFDQLIIVEPLGARIEQTPAKPGAVALGIEFFRFVDARVHAAP
jgi:hypothetical protein